MLYNKPGFSIIEIMIVVLIIGILASVGIPQFTRGRVTAGDQFISRLNGLTQQAVYSAISSSSIKKIIFNFNSKVMSLRDFATDKIERSQDIPNSIEITGFALAGKDQLSQSSQNYDAYFLINPDGITQEITISFIDHARATNKSGGGNYSITLNPFTGRFAL